MTSPLEGFLFVFVVQAATSYRLTDQIPMAAAQTYFPQPGSSNWYNIQRSPNTRLNTPLYVQSFDYYTPGNPGAQVARLHRLIAPQLLIESPLDLSPQTYPSSANLPASHPLDLAAISAQTQQSSPFFTPYQPSLVVPTHKYAGPTAGRKFLTAIQQPPSAAAAAASYQPESFVRESRHFQSVPTAFSLDPYTGELLPQASRPDAVARALAPADAEDTDDQLEFIPQIPPHLTPTHPRTSPKYAVQNTYRYNTVPSIYSLASNHVRNLFRPPSTAFRPRPYEIPSSSSTRGHWGYNDDDGALHPRNWPQEYPVCGKHHQSPINIITDNMVTEEKNRQPLLFNYYSIMPSNLTLTNTGHSAQLTGEWPGSVPSIFGGVLYSQFNLAQIHFHWGQDDSEGSEHTIDANSFPMEMHLVHFRKDQPDAETASKQKDGLLVIGILFEISNEPNAQLRPILQALNHIQKTDATTSVDLFPLNAIVTTPFDSPYVSYAGSLTTPPCSESVTWIISPSPVKISSSQVKQFRALHTANGKPMMENFRPVQQLNGRTVSYVIS